MLMGVLIDTLFELLWRNFEKLIQVFGSFSVNDELLDFCLFSVCLKCILRVKVSNIINICVEKYNRDGIAATM